MSHDTDAVKPKKHGRKNVLRERLARLGLTYQQYLQSGHWITLRARFYAKNARVCWVCRATDGIELHHKTYIRLGAERLTDLIPLCRTHHSKFHEENPSFCMISQKTVAFLKRANDEQTPPGIRWKINGRFTVRDLGAGKGKYTGNFKTIDEAAAALAQRAAALPTREKKPRELKRIQKRAERRRKQREKIC